MKRKSNNLAKWILLCINSSVSLSKTSFLFKNHSLSLNSFELPNGEQFFLKFVANERGYQPESSFLPKAPAFPHPIPQFVLDQIAFAEKQKEEARNQRN